MSYREIDGDLVRDAHYFDVILHGCNCVHVMGAGIALTIAQTWPRAFEADLKTKKDVNKLGGVSVSAPADGEEGPVIVNCYTQPAPGPCVNYDAISDALGCVALMYPGKRVGMPQIGAGLGGGNWSRIKNIIQEVLAPACDVTVVNFNPRVVFRGWV